MTVALALIALLHRVRAMVPPVPEPVERLKIFDVPPPPPPQPVPVPTHVTPVRLRARVERAARPGASRASHDRPPPAVAPLSITPVPMPPTIPVPLQPIVIGAGIGIGDLGDRPGVGASAGNGDADHGKGGTAAPAPRLTRAVWVRAPTRSDFQRAWPKEGRALTIPVQVLLVCSVRKSGRPFDCTIARESVAGLGFGAAAIRLTEGSFVRPVLVDGRRTDRKVIVPLAFLPPDAKPVAPHRDGDP